MSSVTTTIPPDGTGVRDYIHVVDLAKGHVAAVKYVETHKGCDVFNLGTGTGYSVLDMVKTFQEVNNVPVPYKIVDRRPGDLAICYADPAKSAEVLGWKAEMTLADMCRDSWNWQSIIENISYDVLLVDLPYDKEIVEEILELIVDTVCTTKETVRISGDDKPAEVVRSRFLKLDSEHIRFVVSCMKENTTKIKNIRQYLLATLYNASLTMTSYYTALVQHDMAEGRI